MTNSDTDTPPEVRVMCDGGREPATVTKTRTADAVVTRDTGDGDDQEMLRVPISSTRADREGDRFTKEALEDMADQIRVENPMVFDNHGLAGSWMEAIPYDSRETIGTQMDAELESAEDGEWDLYTLVNPDGTHPEGERMLKQVRDEGQAIKYSVGFRVLDYDAIEDDAGNEIGREFTRSDLMETSRVGIPANPDASVTQSMAAKDSAADGLPGYQNHPMMRMLQAMQSGGTPEGTVAKSAGDGDVDLADALEEADIGEDTNDDTDEVAELEAEVEELRAEIASLKESDEDDDDDEDDDEDDGKGSCDVDTDCPEGEVCLEGECVPEDEVDDDDEESSSDTPEAVKELREENKALRDEVAEIRSELSEGRGDAKTGDTGMNDEPPVSPDETDDDTSEEQDTEHKTAMDYARGSE
jgi:hypothetical protein